MSDPAPGRVRQHEDAVLFREAVGFTAARTGFAARLIEKDYFCAVLLEYLAKAAPEVVFKGGTCLAKIHAGFYRLSEDMDYVIPVGPRVTRAKRSELAAGVKDAAHALPRAMPVFRASAPFRGANNSTQYCGSFAYNSPTSGQEETITLEVGLREPLLEPAIVAPARSILLDPVNGEPVVPEVPVRCMSLREAIAEKTRAALTRRGVAIRDFYDIDYAVVHLDVRLDDPALVDLVKAKLAVPGNPPIDVNDERMRELRAQLSAQLRPVLRAPDFAAFNLERAIATVVGIARAVGT
jgi:predicted nucleotidyltransferase component of viral defense system